MTAKVDPLKVSGTNVHSHLFADDETELERWANRLRVPVKRSKKDKVPHLDLNEHKRDLALRYGAEEAQ